MPNLIAYEYAQAHLEELAQVAQQERLANRARSGNDGARTADRSAGNGARHPAINRRFERRSEQRGHQRWRRTLTAAWPLRLITGQ